MRQREPGTGTQYHTYANEPCRCQSRPELPEGMPCPEEHTINHEKPVSKVIDGERWYVGHEYWDSELKDIAKLVAIVGKSSWCDTRDPDECPPKLVFEYERRDIRQSEIDPSDPSGETQERFIERYRRTIERP